MGHFETFWTRGWLTAKQTGNSSAVAHCHRNEWAWGNARGKCQWVGVRGLYAGAGPVNLKPDCLCGVSLVIPCETLLFRLPYKATMIRSTLLLAALLALAAASCDSANTATPPQAPTEAATEAATEAPTGTATEAASEVATDTPLPTIASQTSVAIEPAFPGLPTLTLPVALVDVPDHDLYLIVLQDGLVLAVDRDGPYDAPRTVHDQRERTLRSGGEEGLLAIALDPDFAHKRLRLRLLQLSVTSAGETVRPDSALQHHR